MTVNPFNVVDYLEQSRENITEQFKDKVTIDRILQLLATEKLEIQDVLKDLKQKRSIDTAEGVQLDILGAIVGQDRTLINVDVFNFFGFLGIDNGSFGDVNTSAIGSVFWDINTPRFGNITLTDVMYRLFIKARIATNNTKCTPEDVMKFANFIFETQGSTVQYEGGASYTLMIGKMLSSFEKSLLTYVDERGGFKRPFLPKPAGVGVNYGNFDYTNYFGFSDAPNASGFGDLDINYQTGEHVYDGSFKYTPELFDGVGGKMASFIGRTDGNN